jgi:hypothetical protein
MTELKLTSLEMMREFLTWAKERYTHKLTEQIGGCETCGHGGYQNTVGWETDYAAMDRNLEKDIDAFAAHFKGE